MFEFVVRQLLLRGAVKLRADQSTRSLAGGRGDLEVRPRGRESLPHPLVEGVRNQRSLQRSGRTRGALEISVECNVESSTLREPDGRNVYQISLQGQRKSEKLEKDLVSSQRNRQPPVASPREIGRAHV